MKQIYTICIVVMAISFSNAQSFTNESVRNDASEIQRVRLNLETPSGYMRQLLLGFTPDNAATDSYDYGYDALNNDNYPDDFGWIIEDDAYIIQGVGSFSTNKFYPIGMFLSNSGNVTLSLYSLENFEGVTNVFIYDAFNNTYENLNDSSLVAYSDAGNYHNRFFITFRNDYPQSFWADVLSIDTPKIDNDVTVFYNKIENAIKIKSQATLPITKLQIYNVLGKEVINLDLDKKTALNVSSSNLTKGIYILKISTILGVSSKKIIIN